MYKIQEKGRPETAVWLLNAVTTISNESTADIPFYGSSTGTTKVHIIKRNSELYLQDISNNTAIFHNDHRINHKVQLHHGATVRIADTSYQILNQQQNQGAIITTPDYQPIARDAKHWQLQAIDGDIKGRSFKLGTQTIIGREPDCNICIPSDQLSRKHVQLIVTGGKVMLQDLNSTNGTLVNGKKVEHRIIDEGDDVRVGRITFKLIAPQLSGSSADNRTVVTASVPKVKVELAKKDVTAQLNTTQKSWVTKPTSIGNRKDDSLDIILAKHLHVKKMAVRFFIAGLFSLGVLAYIALN